MFHKEGYKIITIALVTSILSIFLANQFLSPIAFKIIAAVIIILLILILQFFRNPKREITLTANEILAPVDGKVVVIEEVYEPEYFKEKRIQVSIFMSPINVHVTRYPVGGEIAFSKYHPGKYLVAWHPKASEENERTTVVIKNGVFGEILYRQIAGALARRIVNYAKEKMIVTQGADAGFIKFGSRVDLFLPLDTRINVNLNQIVKGSKTVIGESNVRQ